MITKPTKSKAKQQRVSHQLYGFGTLLDTVSRFAGCVLFDGETEQRVIKLEELQVLGDA